MSKYLLLLSYLCILVVCSTLANSESVEFDNMILIKNGIVVNHDGQQKADVLIANGKIHSIGKNLQAEGARIIDAAGKYVMPGGIDPHLHFNLSFMGTFSMGAYTESRAALAGGTTLVIDFALPPGGLNDCKENKHCHMDAYNKYREYMDANMVCDYSLHMGVVDYNEDVEKELEILVKEKGINSFKVFMAYRGFFQMNDDQIFKSFKKARELGAIAMVHAENGDLVVEGQKYVADELGIKGPEGHPLSRPASLEGEATNRAAIIAERAGAPLYVVHVMSKDAMEAVRRAKARGQRIVGEPVIAGLALDDTGYLNKDWDMAARYVMSPPIRSKQDQEELVKALKTGTLDLIATDHCAFNKTQKRMGRDDFRLIPNGVVAVEDRVNVAYDRLVVPGHLSLSDFVRVTSTKAAQIFNIYPRKGAIKVGSDADIAIFDPKAAKVIGKGNSGAGWSAFEGRELQGSVVTTISAGKVVFENGQLTEEAEKRGRGKFVPNPPFGSLYGEGAAQKEWDNTRPQGVDRD